MAVAVTAASTLPLVLPPLSGLGTCVHWRPFQCRTSVWSAAPLVASPTAHALLLEVAAMPKSSLLCPGLGLVTVAHWWPFQCTIKVVILLLVKTSPTAQASLWEVAATLNRSLSLPVPPGLGLGTCVQVVPSQCRIRVWSPAPLEKKPTAQASLADTARTL